MEKEKIIEILDFLKTSLENTSDNNELDKLKGECKRWKNASFKTLIWLVLALRKLSPGVLYYFSVSNALKIIEKLVENETFVKESEDMAKELFKEITGEEYVED